MRLPAVRGKILDREGRVLAENRPRYNLSLYLDDLRKPVRRRLRPVAASRRVKCRNRPSPRRKKTGPFADESRTETIRVHDRTVGAAPRAGALDAWRATWSRRSAQQLGQPLALDPAKFERAYETRLALPFTILPNLDRRRSRGSRSNSPDGLGADLDLQAVARLSVRRDGGASARLFAQRRQFAGRRGRVFQLSPAGLSRRDRRRRRFDAELRGRAGAESVLVNNLGYRQSENILDPPEPGHNVVLTIDLDIQRAAAESLARASGRGRARARSWSWTCAAATCWRWCRRRAIDPNDFAQGISQEKWQQIQHLTAEKNRAT